MMSQPVVTRGVFYLFIYFFGTTAFPKLPKADTVEARVQLNALFISACCDVTVISMLTPCATSQDGILGS